MRRGASNCPVVMALDTGLLLEFSSLIPSPPQHLFLTYPPQLTATLSSKVQPSTSTVAVLALRTPPMPAAMRRK